MNFKEIFGLMEAKDKAYEEFFQKMLKKYKVSAPDELDKETRAKFFDEVDKGWKADKEED